MKTIGILRAGGWSFIARLQKSVLSALLWVFSLQQIVAQPPVAPSQTAPGKLMSIFAAPKDLKINEIRPLAKTNPVGSFQHSFVELYNAGDKPQHLQHWQLVNGKGKVIAALPAWILPGRSFLTVYFGQGQNDSSFTDRAGHFYTQGDSLVFDPSADEVGLYRGSLSIAGIQDFVSWSNTGTYLPGIAHDHAQQKHLWKKGAFVNRSAAGPLSSLGLCPDGYDNNQVSDWREFDWGTYFIGGYYGKPNPIQIAPLHESVITTDSVTLVWASRPGATGYRLQISSQGPDFNNLMTDITLKDTNYTLPVGYGIFHWRVFVLTPRRLTEHAVWLFRKAPAPSNEQVKVLPVPHLLQHKDTRMLCVSNDDPPRPLPFPVLFTRPGCSEFSGPLGPWDNEHPEDHALEGCEHCGYYCARASIAMINHYAGGDLSQDRISYQVFKDYVPWAEMDLGHNTGLYNHEITSAYSWALNGVPVAHMGFYLPFNTIVTEIDAGKPLLVHIPGHAMVVAGYRFNPLAPLEQKYIYVLDPWPPHHRSGWKVYGQVPIEGFWQIATGLFGGRAQETTVKSDAEGDGVVDFDEQNRFCSNYLLTDTDDDQVPDKKDIRSYVFHPVDHAACPTNPAFLPNLPDIDADMDRAECDCDSDGDLDFDGGEDIDGAGDSPLIGGESCVYDKNDKIMLVVPLPGPVFVAGQMVQTTGSSLHQNSVYHYEVQGGCPIAPGSAIFQQGLVQTNATGSFGPQAIGVYPPGVYTFVLDLNENFIYDDCDVFTCFSVIPNPLRLDGVVVPPSKPGASDGSIDLTVEGCTPPYFFEWSNGATTEDLTDLPEGVYTVTVISSDDCVETAEFTLSVTDCNLTIAHTVVPAGNPFFPDGAVYLIVFGGTPPYSFQWSNGSTQQNLTGVAPGAYTVTLTDAAGCSLTASFEVPEAVPLNGTNSRNSASGAGLAPSAIVFPNPASDALNIRLARLPETPVLLRIFDPAGSLRLEQQIAAPHRSTEIKVNTRQLLPGPYWLELSAGGYKTHTRFVVMR